MESAVRQIMSSLHRRVEIAARVARLGLPDCWIGAGFVRNAVWDALHHHPRPTPLNDVDVVYYDRADTSYASEAAHAALVQRDFPHERFSFRNQARMHRRNGHEPYLSSADAISRWTETCTTVAVAWTGSSFDVLAPHGLDDLFALIVRPTSADADMVKLVARRVEEKGWLSTWPLLRLEAPLSSQDVA
ncbi:nucleotidyltransferase family protein [Micromonospora sp. GCM10011542]|uniref:nucleotidyltransferase family protein n=1 Tax=Micromonospora sp. GCM10011542 TaxID=3317337 RepID=UPI00362331AD